MPHPIDIPVSGVKYTCTLQKDRTAGTTRPQKNLLTRPHPFFAAPTAMRCVLETMKRQRSLTKSGAVIKTPWRACSKSQVMSLSQLQRVVLSSASKIRTA